MNDWKLGIENLRQIGEAGLRENPTFSERCGLFSAARTISADLEKHVETYLGSTDGYISEKNGKAIWHIGAILGFDVDNGHDAEQHYAWALGQLSTLEDLLTERLPDD